MKKSVVSRNSTAGPTAPCPSFASFYDNIGQPPSTSINYENTGTTCYYEQSEETPGNCQVSTYGHPEFPPLPTDRLRFPGVPKTFMARRRTNHSSQRNNNDPDYLETVLNPGPTGHSMMMRQQIKPTSVQGGRGNRLTKSTDMFACGGNNNNMPKKPVNLRSAPRFQQSMKKSFREELPTRYDYDDLSEEEFNALMRSNSGDKKPQFRTLDLLKQFDSAVSKPNPRIAQGALKNVKKTGNVSSREKPPVFKKRPGVRDALGREEIKARVEQMKNEIMNEIGTGSSPIGGPIKGKNSEILNPDKSLKMLHSKIDSILDDLVPKPKQKSLSKYSKFNPLASLSMEMPSKQSFKTNPMTSYHRLSKKDFEPSQEPLEKPKANLTLLTNQFQEKMNEIAAIDSKALIPVPEVEDRFSVLHRKNFFDEEDENESEDETNFEQYGDDEKMSDNFLPSQDPRRKEENSLVQMKQEFRKKVITKNLSSPFAKVDRVNDEEYIFHENPPLEDDENESSHTQKSEPPLKPFKYSEMMKLRNVLETSPPLFKPTDAYELDAHARNQRSSGNSEPEEELLKKLEKVNQLTTTPETKKIDSGRQKEKLSGTNVLLDMPTSSRFLMKASGDHNMGYMPSGEAGKKLQEAVRRIDDPKKVARTLESIRTISSEDNNNVLKPAETKASDFLTYWSEHVRKNKIIEPTVKNVETSDSDEDEETSYVLNQEQQNKVKAVTSMISVESSNSANVEPKNGSSLMVSSGTGPLTPRSATAGTILERGVGADVPKDLQFTPDMTFTERLMLQKLRGLQRSWTAEVTTKKE